MSTPNTNPATGVSNEGNTDFSDYVDELIDLAFENKIGTCKTCPTGHKRLETTGFERAHLIGFNTDKKIERLDKKLDDCVFMCKELLRRTEKKN